MGRGAPVRGRGAPIRGRGAPVRGRGASARGASQAAVVKFKTKSKTEKERDALDLMKPWVTDELRAEIKKKHEMHSKSRESKDASDFEAFKEQRNKVSAMLRAAKMEYIGLHDEDDVDKILADAVTLAKENVTAAENANHAEPKAENGAEATPVASEDAA
ncbi:DNA-binding protein K10-like [Pollicipes pollicipes]|uniref:DNA-binding protein K10-like n=1 Tax=Pollicipes pollicipes TaxID=41117 RepID=UPI001884A122|nr:DNA-binding protein K10-like [Pollicipes pollicipes]XP_037090103.1 DNA-binding protein K10-like [Pollicipes pollicipes]